MTVQYWRFFEHLEAYARSQNNLHWPNWVVFNKLEFQQLIVEDSKMSEVSDTAWEQFELDRDTRALAIRRALFLRSVFAPSLACALSPARSANGSAAVAFADELEQRLQQRLMDQPEEMRSLAHTLVLAKKKPS